MVTQWFVVATRFFLRRQCGLGCGGADNFLLFYQRTEGTVKFMFLYNELYAAFVAKAQSSKVLFSQGGNVSQRHCQRFEE
jgi:hypothetical protein